MVHTAFASSEPEAVIKFEAMKRRLEVLLSELDADTSDVDDALEVALDAFCDDFI